MGSNLSLAYLMLSAILFVIGGVGVLIRRNPLVMIMCVELMLNAVNLSFVTFGKMLDDVSGQIRHVVVPALPPMTFGH